MKNRSGLIIALAVAAVVLAAVLLYPRTEKSVEVADSTGPTPSNQPETLPEAAAPPSVAESTPVEPSGSAPTAPSAMAASEEEADSTKITFRADAKGRMVTDQSARLNLEKLYALYTPAERQQKLDELSATLPPAAARDLNDMMERYINYDTAARQTFPPGQELSSPEEGLTIIDGMNKLRVQYFGAAAAAGFFGKEENIQRELLRLMSLENDDSKTIEEKAERAQALYKSQMPETAAEIEAGRKQAEAAPRR